jgi:hypothetical protein
MKFENAPELSLDAWEQLRKSLFESPRNKIEVPNRDITLSPFHVSKKRSIQPRFLCHFHLSPAVLLPQPTNTVSKSEQEFVGHQAESSGVAQILQSVFTQHSAWRPFSCSR